MCKSRCHDDHRSILCLLCINFFVGVRVRGGESVGGSGVGDESGNA